MKHTRSAHDPYGVGCPAEESAVVEGRERRVADGAEVTGGTHVARGDVHRLGGRVEGPPERYLQKEGQREGKCVS